MNWGGRCTPLGGPPRPRRRPPLVGGSGSEPDGYSGFPLPGVKLSIEDGEVVARGPFAEAPVHTGDLGRLVEDGSLIIEGPPTMASPAEDTTFVRPQWHWRCNRCPESTKRWCLLNPIPAGSTSPSRSWTRCQIWKCSMPLPARVSRGRRRMRCIGCPILTGGSRLNRRE